MTAHREKLFPLEPFKKEEALEIIHTVEKFQERYLKEKGSRIVFIADEFYVLAEKDYPDYDAYESFPQLENGVGLLASFEKEFNDAFEETQPLKKALYGGKRETISIATGKAAENYIRRLCQKVTAVYPVNISVWCENRFSGLSYRCRLVDRPRHSGTAYRQGFGKPLAIAKPCLCGERTFWTI